jgi:hypothetical protein
LADFGHRIARDELVLLSNGTASASSSTNYGIRPMTFPTSGHLKLQTAFV